MKHTLIAIVLFAFCCILACTKESGTIHDTPAPQDGATINGAKAGRANARLSGSHYSQSIPVDTANSMIQSYLASVRYPQADSALRSLTFDADTLRAYLQNPNIVTIKLMLAHQPAYKNSKNGQYAGMKPEALTFIVVGLNEAGQYVRNNRNEVYEHFSPCPNNCQVTGAPYIQ